MDNMKKQQHDKMFRFEKYYKQLKHIIVSIFLIGLMFTIIILLAAIIYFHQLTKEASSISDDALKHKVIHFAGDDLINYKNNDILDEYDHSLNSLIVGPKHVSPEVIKALTSSEDTLFFQHNGILPKAIIRAMFQDILQNDQSSGGSTITQQLIKNQVLSNEKTYSRKANEIILAQRLERIMSKKEIIYTYLN
ncbi:transglycosylase, partial [Staphylococcus warneri]